MSDLNKSKEYASVKYWPTHFSLWILKKIAGLSNENRYRLGVFLGKSMSLLARRRRRIAKINIELCFPNLTEAETEKRIKENMIATGLGMVETASCWFTDLDEQHKTLNFKGREHLDAALAKGKGVLLLSFHMTTLEMGGGLLGKYYKVTGMYKPNKNPLFDEAMVAGRLKHIHGLIDRNNIRATVKMLRKNEIIWYATDQNNGGKTRTFVPFFDIQTSTITATTKLAKMTGATVVPFTQKRLDKFGNYELELHPAFEPFPNENEVVDATMINSFLESYLVKNPVDYMWLHQRFRTRPEGEPPIY